MNFKQFLVRLFHIQPSDLQEHKQSYDTSSQLDDQIRIEIKKQIQQEIPQIMKTEILPEIRKLLEENRASAITPGGQTTSPQQEIDRGTKMDAEHPLIKEEPEPPQHHLPQVTEAEPILPVEITRPVQTPKVMTSIINKELRLGIDFGTTTTSVSVKVGEDLPIAIPIGKDGVTRYMPSVVYINPGGGNWHERVVVGEDAESQGDETKRIRSIKRCFDCEGDRCKVAAAQGELRPPPWCVGDGNVQITEREIVPPSDIAYLIIKEALERAKIYMRDYWGNELADVELGEIQLNMGCGARFSQTQREMLVSIAKELGFKRIRIGNIVEEPILAGFAFSRFGENPEGYSLVYDFGGGTLDIAVIDVVMAAGQPMITVLATSGNPWLGGDDIDSVVYQEFIRQIASSVKKTPTDMERELSWLDRSNLRSRAKKAKELLTDQRLYEDTYYVDGLGFMDLSLNIEKFEALLANSGLVEKSLQAVHEALKLALALDEASKSDLFDTNVFRLLLSHVIRHPGG